MGGEIKVNPENYAEMIQKLKDREDEQTQKVFAKRRAETEEELKELAKARIVKRAQRSDPEYTTLKDRKVLTEPKSDAVAELRKRLENEIASVAKGALAGQQRPTEGELKGRIKPGGSAPAA